MGTESQLKLEFDSDIERFERDEKIMALLNQVLDNMTPLPDRLWTIKEAGVYFRVSEHTARRILTQPGAPQPIKLPTSKTTRTPVRYRAEEVIEFAVRRSRVKRRVPS